MKVYLVGGAVRDKLLDIPVKERDWVVVGSCPEEMIKQGFKQVGKDFPVFLHPQTKEEYALARRERKVKPGYTGFAFDYDKQVTLEEDLLRRDLTINAMAMDDSGHLIDPYQGQADLKAKCLRHVSEAFVEDPVRVLRLARFKAKFHALGFQIANVTAQKVYQMVMSGELKALVAERVWQEWEKSFLTDHPEQFILALRQLGALPFILPEINALFGVPIDVSEFPTIDLGLYLLENLKAARQKTADSLLLFAELTYVLGFSLKRTQWPLHLKKGPLDERCVSQLCQRLRIPHEYRDLAILLIQYRLQLDLKTALSAEEILSVLTAAGAFRQGGLLDKLLSFGDAHTQAFWQACLKACLSINMQTILAGTPPGNVIQQKVMQVRIQAIEGVKNEK